MVERKKDKNLAERTATLEAKLNALQDVVESNEKKNAISHEWFYRLLKRLSDRDYMFLVAIIGGSIAFVVFLLKAFSQIKAAETEMLTRIIGALEKIVR